MKKYLWFAVPLLIVIDMVLLSKILSMISAPNDAAFWTGILFLCLLIFGNYLVYRFFRKIKNNSN